MNFITTFVALHGIFQCSFSSFYTMIHTEIAVFHLFSVSLKALKICQLLWFIVRVNVFWEKVFYFLFSADLTFQFEIRLFRFVLTKQFIDWNVNLPKFYWYAGIYLQAWHRKCSISCWILIKSHKVCFVNK